LGNPSNPYTPRSGETVHFRKRAAQSELRKSTDKNGWKQVKTQMVVEAVGDVIGVTGDGRVTIKMTSWMEETGTWIVAKKGIVMNVYLDDVDLL
jgi:hypothetical protein